MIWIDRKNKRCKSVEDWNYFQGEPGLDLYWNELRMNRKHPVTIVSFYNKLIQKDDVVAKIFCYGFGDPETAGKGGWRDTVINSYN